MDLKELKDTVAAFIEGSAKRQEVQDERLEDMQESLNDLDHRIDSLEDLDDLRDELGIPELDRRLEEIESEGFDDRLEDVEEALEEKADLDDFEKVQADMKKFRNMNFQARLAWVLFGRF